MTRQAASPPSATLQRMEPIVSRGEGIELLAKFGFRPCAVSQTQTLPHESSPIVEWMPTLFFSASQKNGEYIYLGTQGAVVKRGFTHRVPKKNIRELAAQTSLSGMLFLTLEIEPAATVVPRVTTEPNRAACDSCSLSSTVALQTSSHSPEIVFIPIHVGIRGYRNVTRQESTCKTFPTLLVLSNIALEKQ